MKKLISIITIFAIFICSTCGAFASTSSVAVKENTTNNSNSSVISEKEIEIMDPYVKENNSGEFYIDYNALPENIPESLINKAEQVIELTNSYNSDNSLDTSSLSEKNNSNEISYSYKAKRGGVTKFVKQWYGYDVYLSNYACGVIDDTYEVAAIFASAEDIFLGAAVVVFQKIIKNTNEGNGVILKMVSVPITPTMPQPYVMAWCKAQ